MLMLMKMMSHHINVSLQGIQIAGWCGVGQIESGFTAPLVHVQDQLGGVWWKKYSGKLSEEGSKNIFGLLSVGLGALFGGKKYSTLSMFL